MKKAIVIITCITILLTGCNLQEPLDPNKYKNYKCFDWNLVCLDAYEQKDKATVEFDDLEYTIWYRKVVDMSDEQFICASVSLQHPLDTPSFVVMQNPDNYIDVFSDWTIKSIELYCIDLYNSKPIWEEDEPARTPSSIINTNTNSVVFDELVGFITNTENTKKYILKEGFERELPNDDYVVYIRVHFNESDNIVWDSRVSSYASHKTQARDIIVGKGGLPDGIAEPNSHTGSIEAYPNLYKWVSEAIDSIMNGN